MKLSLKKISLPKWLKVVFKVLCLAIVVTTIVLSYLQIKGLRHRMSMAENRLNDGGIYLASSYKAEDPGSPTFKLLDTKDVSIKVAQYSNDGSGATYVPKTMRAYTVEITNTTKWNYDIDTYNMKAKTDQGVLVSSSTDIDPSEETYLSVVPSLAPGGKTSITLYFLPIKGQQFVGLYEPKSQNTIK